MSSWSEIVVQVEARAASRCEYCRMHQALQGGTSPSMPRAELGTALPTRQGSICYEMLRFPVLAEILGS